MKLAAKIALCLVALLGIVFAIGGFVMIDSNFDRGLESDEARGLIGHLAAKETLRGNLANAMYEGEAVQDYTVASWGEQMGLALAADNGMCAILNEGYTAYYSNLPREFGKSVQASILAQDRYIQSFYRFSGSTYLVFPDKISMNGDDYWLISVFDITQIFEERQMQTNTFYTIYTIVLACAIFLAVAVSMLITRPLRQLEKIAKSIAAGAYDQRTGLSGKDEIRQLAASFDVMATAIEERVAQLTLSAKQREDFMGAFTHELKTPMTAMMGYASLLKKEALHGEEKDRALGYIHSETRRLEDLSQKLLLLMGLDEGSTKLAPVRIEMVLHKVQGAFPQDGARMVLPDSKGSTVYADADLLADLIINLVHNGFQAQPADGIVHIGLEENNGMLILSVKDFGKGIASEKLARLTEPFFRMNSDRHTEGNGLGLTLCERIAELHGTELHFESEPGEGTTVWVALQASGDWEVENDEAH